VEKTSTLNYVFKQSLGPRCYFRTRFFVMDLIGLFAPLLKGDPHAANDERFDFENIWLSSV
jgi:hypothetical protein